MDKLLENGETVDSLTQTTGDSEQPETERGHYTNDNTNRVTIYPLSRANTTMTFTCHTENRPDNRSSATTTELETIKPQNHPLQNTRSKTTHYDVETMNDGWVEFLGVIDQEKRAKLERMAHLKVDELLRAASADSEQSSRQIQDMDATSCENQKVHDLNTLHKQKLKEQMLNQLAGVSNSVKMTREVMNEVMTSMTTTVETLTLRGILQAGKFQKRMSPSTSLKGTERQTPYHTMQQELKRTTELLKETEAQRDQLKKLMQSTQTTGTSTNAISKCQVRTSGKCPTPKRVPLRTAERQTPYHAMQKELNERTQLLSETTAERNQLSEMVQSMETTAESNKTIIDCQRKKLQDINEKMMELEATNERLAEKLEKVQSDTLLQQMKSKNQSVALKVALRARTLESEKNKRQITDLNHKLGRLESIVQTQRRREETRKEEIWQFAVRMCSGLPKKNYADDNGNVSSRKAIGKTFGMANKDQLQLRSMGLAESKLEAEQPKLNGIQRQTMEKGETSGSVNKKDRNINLYKNKLTSYKLKKALSQNVELRDGITKTLRENDALKAQIKATNSVFSFSEKEPIRTENVDQIRIKNKPENAGKVRMKSIPENKPSSISSGSQGPSLVGNMVIDDSEFIALADGTSETHVQHSLRLLSVSHGKLLKDFNLRDRWR